MSTDRESTRADLRDLRDVPFFMVGTDATAAIRAKFKGKRRATAIAVYAALVERANEARSQRFRSTRKAVGEYAGATPRTVDDYVAEFERMGLLRVTRERAAEGMNLPNLWELLTVGEPSSSAGGGEAERTTPSAAKRTRGGEAKRTQRQEHNDQENNSAAREAAIEKATDNPDGRDALRALGDVAGERGADFEPDKLIAECRRYPDRDHVAEALRFRDFYTAGGSGENVVVKSLGGRWRTWLGRAPRKGSGGRARGNGRRRPNEPTSDELRAMAADLRARGL